MNPFGLEPMAEKQMIHFSLPSLSLSGKKSGHSSMNTFGSGCSNSTVLNVHSTMSSEVYSHIWPRWSAEETPWIMYQVSPVFQTFGSRKCQWTFSRGQSTTMPSLVTCVISSSSGTAMSCTCHSPPVLSTPLAQRWPV